jgi:hypothetical protein
MLHFFPPPTGDGDDGLVNFSNRPDLLQAGNSDSGVAIKHTTVVVIDLYVWCLKG